ncbi:unnamed protein product [Nippostrongylus brasiliensis]|uniref:ATPase n=1 Tax=Nippostrongylus brasiliensis TaxID=27835 RepID=A0A0N4YBM4_NIPBR|nr:unnamed protein product [Nippostrongylus brasiliensis]
MSVQTVVKDTQLVGQHLFDHTPYVRQEIERKEVNIVVKAYDERLIEAAETPVEALFETGKMQTLSNDINQLAARIQKLTEPTYAKEHADYLAEVAKKQKEILELRRSEAHLKMRK